MSLPGAELIFQLQAARLSLQAGMDEFTAFAAHRLAALLQAQAGVDASSSSSHASSHAAPEVDVRVRLHWNARPPLSWQSNGVRQWGRRLLQLGPRLLMSDLPGLPGLDLAAEWHGQHFYVEAYYRPPVRRLGWLSLSRRTQPALFSALLYYLVYFPLFYFLEQTQGWRLLHAAAVSHPAGAWLLAGLPGSGKTTLALSLLADPQARLMADNLLLFNRQEVLGVPERIHLGDASRALLPIPVQRLLQETGNRSTYERQEIELGAQTTRLPAAPRSLVFVGQGERTDLLPSPAPLSTQRLAALNEMAREIQAYSFFSAALELIALHPGKRACWQGDLEALLASVPAAELWLERGAGLSQASALLNQAAVEGR